MLKDVMTIFNKKMNCINCFVDYSPTWRNGYCNACGIHFKKYGVHRDHVKIYAKILCNLK